MEAQNQLILGLLKWLADNPRLTTVGGMARSESNGGCGANDEVGSLHTEVVRGERRSQRPLMVVTFVLNQCPRSDAGVWSVIDARDAAWASVPDWHDPGKANPRALGGILGARMHVVRDGELLDLSTTSSAERQPESGKMPGGFLLMQNYPNPFNPTTVVRFQVPARSGVEWPVVVRVRLTVCDVLGREVAVLTNEVLQPGSHEVTWNAAGFAGGVYFARMTAGSYTATRKLVLVR